MNMKMNKFHSDKILLKKYLKEKNWTVEKKYINNFKEVVSIDEVGRGALAGPLALGSIYLDKTVLKIIEKNNLRFYDSKELNEKQREEFFKIIKKLGIPYKLVFISNKKIEKIGIQESYFLGIKKIINYFQPNFLILDGKKAKFQFKKYKFFIKGDKILNSLGAASIIAKFKRDKLMKRLHWKYPVYFWNKNKGYGTKEHLKAIKKFGISPLHRKNFLSFMEDKAKEPFV